MRRRLLYTGGVINLVLAFTQLLFWRVGNIPVELAKLTADVRGKINMLCFSSAYLMLFSSFMAFYIARKQRTDFTDKAVLVFIAGFYFLRILFGYPLFGFSSKELIIWSFCLLTALFFILALKNE